MIPILALALAQTAAKAEPVPAQVVYKVKIAEGSKVVSSPVIRTLDGEAAQISESGPVGKPSFSVKLLPKVNADSSTVSMLHLTYGGVTYPGLEVTSTGKDTTYIVFSRPEHKKVSGHMEDSLTWRVSAPNSVITARKDEVLLELKAEVVPS